MSDTDPSNACKSADDIPTDELLAELRRLADELGESPTMAEMDEHGAYSASTYQSRFGSWTQAKERGALSTDDENVEYTDAELVEDLRAFADELGETPTKAEMRSSGPHSPSTYASRFGSWTEALREAGLDAREEATGIPEADLVAELRRVAETLDRRPTSEEFDEHGQYSAATYFRRFGSWQAALERADVADSYPPASRTQVSDSDLAAELEQMAAVLGRPPTVTEMDELGDHSAETYRRRFGSWRDAVREAGLDPDLLPSGGQKRRIPAKRLVADIERVASELGRPPTYQEMQSDGEFAGATYLDRFGSWNRALEAAGFDGRRYRGDRIPTRELIRELRDLTLRLGQKPRRKDMNRDGQYAGMTYYNRFGSWSEALAVAGVRVRDGRTVVTGHCDVCGTLLDGPVSDFPGEQGLFCDEACREIGTSSTICFESNVLPNDDGDPVGRLAAAVRDVGTAIPSRILFALRHALDLLDSEFESAEVQGHELTSDGDAIRVTWDTDGEARLRIATETVRRVNDRIEAVESARSDGVSVDRVRPLVED